MLKLIKKISLFLPILLTMIWVNWTVDPAHLLSNKFYTDAAQKLKSSNIVLPGNCNEHLLIKEMLAEQTKKSGLVLGSSRSLIINEAEFGSADFFNLSLSASNLEDIIAAYGIYYSKFGIPKKVIIGIDPWIFNENRTSEKHFALADEYNAVAELLGFEKVPNEGLKHYSNLISPTYLQESILSIMKDGFEETLSEQVDDLTLPHKNKIKLSNGTIVYPNISLPNKELIDQGVKVFYNDDMVLGFNEYEKLSESKTNMLRTFLVHLKEQAEVILFFPPYHPDMWKHIKENRKYQNAVKAEEHTRKLANELGIETIGSYDPSKYELKSTDFYNAVHANHWAHQKIFGVEGDVEP
ncbi:MAG: DUF1574 domain-containing protein [Crocinitomicaceae bacterium]|nr:DUF1574 domain-containing protein [Crocinitomicaceae bacterium]